MARPTTFSTCPKRIRIQKNFPDRLRSEATQGRVSGWIALASDLFLTCEGVSLWALGNLSCLSQPSVFLFLQDFCVGVWVCVFTFPLRPCHKSFLTRHVVAAGKMSAQVILAFFQGAHILLTWSEPRIYSSNTLNKSRNIFFFAFTKARRQRVEMTSHTVVTRYYSINKIYL